MFDHKEAQLVSYYVNRIRAQTFDERDLHGLLILLREHASGGTPIRELGDFVAHCVRDRGEFLRFLEDHRLQIEKLPTTEDTNPAPEIIDAALSEQGVYGESEVLSSLNDVLASAGVPLLPSDLAGDILVCTMSLLQDVRFVDDQKAEVGGLFFVIAKSRAGLLGQIRLSDGRLAAVSVLSMQNRYHRFEPRTPKEVGLVPNTALIVVRRSGALLFESL